MATHGFLLINKPTNQTSHDIVNYLRKITGIKKIGHAGTLDPFAAGLLIIGIGRESTKKLDKFKKMSKTYVAKLKLGYVSDSFDKTGNISKYKNIKLSNIQKNKIIQVLNNFIGKQKQIPPMFSAKKINGKKLYELARKGIEIERRPCNIEIFDIKLLNTRVFPFLIGARITISVKCSSGTYIRTLCHDIGRMLGTGAYCQKLTRIKIGEYSVKKAAVPKKLTKKNWRKKIFLKFETKNLSSNIDRTINK